MKTLNKRAWELAVLFHTATDGIVYRFIEETTSTRDQPLRLTGLVDKILADPQDVAWVLAEGYLNRYCDRSTAFEFEDWKRQLLVAIERENAAIDKINATIGDDDPNPIVRDYVTSGYTRCPYPGCKSMEIEGELPVIDGKHAHQECYCNTCEGNWTDIYTLSDVKLHDPIEEDK